MFCANLGAIVGSAAVSYWLSKVVGAPAAPQYGYLGTDSSGNSYCIVGDGSGFDGVLYKLNSAGTLQWAKTLTGATNVSLWKVAVSTTGDCYFQNANSLQEIVKINTSGVLQWEKVYSLAAVNADHAGVAVDSAGALIVLVSGNASITSKVLKLTAAGALTWQREIDGGGGFGQAGTVAVDGSNNVYATNYNGVAPGAINVIKYSSAGTLQWQKDISINSNIISHTVDTSGNVYFTASFAGSGIIIKLDTTGALVWQRSAAGTNYYDCTVDSATGDVYAYGNNTAGNAQAILHKYSSSGATTWQRQFAAATTPYALSVNKVSLTGTSELLVSMSYSYTSNVGEAVWKIPADGTKTGTYSSLVYAANTTTITTPTFTSTAGTATLTTPTGTLANSTSITVSASALTSAFTNIP